MYHPRLKGSYYEAGKHYATLLYQKGIRFPQITTEQLTYGMQCLPILKKFDPNVIQEIKGFAEGFQTNVENVSAFLLSLGVFEMTGQCSIFAAYNGEEVIVGRNYDMRYEFRKTTEAAFVDIDRRYPYIGHSDCFIGKVDGINTHGLFVGISAVPHEGIQKGINFYFAVKYILENCRTVAEGIEVLRKFPSSVGNNYLLADSSGEMAVVEVAPHHFLVNRPNGPYIHCTNHHARTPASPKWNWSKSKERHVSLDQRLQEDAQNMTIDIAKSIMSETKGHVCLNLKKHQFGTLYSVVANLNTLEIHRAEGSPQRAKYQVDTRLGKSYN
ncbi:choloylglycine hydrolase [Hazenella sp. IB182357]|uniref:Choloylglycine hydrolase n=1 Tax=Polycladospora coralii TaxID=2771432 RepID=A0A926NHA0_9BACL|nr:C45 family peptidase [Polycladospora coralii]MBD1373539.1 choloylglycine hydrolase [Polycladospora coralii]